MATMGIFAPGTHFWDADLRVELGSASKELGNVWKLPCQPDP